MGRNSRTGRRATAAAKAERHAGELAARLGAALKDARRAARLTQAESAHRAGLTQPTWSSLENDRDPRYTLLTWDCAAFAVGATLETFLRGGSAAGLPRDAAHLRAQELIIRMAVRGDWKALPEELIDREARTSRAADVLLYRRRASEAAEYALMEVIDWFSDVGAPMRAWASRQDAVDRYAVARMVADDPLPRTSGCWIIRATRRNRDLIATHSHTFRARFPGSGTLWLKALTDPHAAIPGEAALMWVSVSGERLFASRLGRP